MSSMDQGEAPRCSFSIASNGKRGKMYTMHIDDIVAALKAEDQPAARKHFGITGEKWKLWRATAEEA